MTPEEQEREERERRVFGPKGRPVTVEQALSRAERAEAENDALRAQVRELTERSVAAESMLHRVVVEARSYVDMTQWLDIDFCDDEEEAEAEKALARFKAVLAECPE